MFPRRTKAGRLPNRLRSAAFGAALVGLIAVVILYYQRNDPSRVEAGHLTLGDQLLREHLPADAALEYQAALRARPDSASSFRKLADAYRQAGDFRRAGDAYRRAADLSAADIEAALRAGWYSLLQNQPDAAERYAREALTIDPGNLSAQRLLANALAAQRNLDGAIDALRELADREPLRATTFTNLGMLEAARGQGDAARAAFDRAAELGDGAVPTRGPMFFAGLGNVDLGGGPVTVTATVVPNEDGTSSVVEFAGVDPNTGRNIAGGPSNGSNPPEVPPVAQVPEPASLWLLVSGIFAGAGAYISRRLRRLVARSK